MGLSGALACELSGTFGESMSLIYCACYTVHIFQFTVSIPVVAVYVIPPAFIVSITSPCMYCRNCRVDLNADLFSLGICFQAE